MLELRIGESIAEACYLEAWGWIGTERFECSEDIEAWSGGRREPIV